MKTLVVVLGILLVISVLLNIVLAILLRRERRGRARDKYLMMGDFD